MAAMAVVAVVAVVAVARPPPSRRVKLTATWWI